MLKISTKLTLFYLSASAIIIGLMAMSSYYIYYAQRITSIDSELHDYAELLTTNLYIEKTNISFIYELLQERKDKSKRLHSLNFQFILTSNDSVIYESSDMEDLLTKIIDSDDSSQTNVYRTISVNKGQFRVYNKKFKNPLIKEFEIIMVTSLDRFSQSLSQLSYILFLVSPLLLLIAAGIGYTISRRAFAPVRNIIKTAEKISAENLGMRVPVGTTEDELAMLARTFNDMIDRLYITFNSQKKFIADASHDFRTPLTIVKLELELLYSNPELSNSAKESIERCIGEIKSMGNLAENLLLLARADSHQLSLSKQIFRLEELILDIVSNFRAIAKANQKKFNINIEDPVEINADKEMIKRVLINIIDNAIKYSPLNTVIVVNLNETDNSNIIEISNQGTEIEVEKIPQLFDRFERADTSRTSKGFGLGLPIIKTIIEAHNGRVNFISKNEEIKLSIILPK